MSVNDILDKSHLLVLQTIEDLPETQWDIPGVAGDGGDWTVKDVVAHLTMRELLLLDILNNLNGAEPGRYLKGFAPENRAAFNKSELEKRRYATAQQIEDEYNDAQVQTTSLLALLPTAKVQQPGTITLFGVPMSLAELIISLAEQTREHCEQIKQFRATHQGSGIIADPDSI